MVFLPALSSVVTGLLLAENISFTSSSSDELSWYVSQRWKITLYEAQKYHVMISTDLCLVPDVFNIQVNKYYGMI